MQKILFTLSSTKEIEKKKKKNRQKKKKKKTYSQEDVVVPMQRNWLKSKIGLDIRW